MNGISPVLEINETESEILRKRSSDLSNPKHFGPADLCIVTREYKPRGFSKLVHKPYHYTSFHYIYGVNTSSVTSIAAYFKHLSDSFSKLNKAKIVSGCFCTFDIFNNCDVRVEINMPGHTSMFIVDNFGRKSEPKDCNWKGCYLSSVLRYFYPKHPVASLIEMFSSPVDIQYFFQVAQEYWDKLGFAVGDLDDLEQYGVSLLFPRMNEYLLSKELNRLHQRIYKQFIEKDPLYLCFLAESSIKVGKFDEIITLISNQLKITPHAFPLYYSMARIYYKQSEYSLAINILQYLTELNLEVFEHWELLIKSYIKQQNFSSALICLNSLPIYSLTPDPDPKETFPERPETISCFGLKFFWRTPETPDFITFEQSSASKTAKEKTLLKKIKSLKAGDYTGGHKRAYKLLVKIEKNMSWDNLLKLRSDLLRRNNLILDDSSDNISNDLNRSGILRTVNESLDQSIRENDTNIDFSLQPAQCLTLRNYFIKEKDSNRIMNLFSTQQRCQSELMTELFSSLHADLKVIYEWQKEISSINAIYDSSKSKELIEIPYMGELWMRRGMLSERLLRYKSALRSYEHATQKGFSLFAWSRIINLNAKAGCPLSAIKGIAEVMRLIENQKVYFDKLPPWIGQVLARLCRECGVRQVLGLIKDHAGKFKVLEDTVNKLKSWEFEGSA